MSGRYGGGGEREREGEGEGKKNWEKGEKLLTFTGKRVGSVGDEEASLSDGTITDNDTFNVLRLNGGKKKGVCKNECVCVCVCAMNSPACFVNIIIRPFLGFWLV